MARALIGNGTRRPNPALKRTAAPPLSSTLGKSVYGEVENNFQAVFTETRMCSLLLRLIIRLRHATEHRRFSKHIA